MTDIVEVVILAAPNHNFGAAMHLWVCELLSPLCRGLCRLAAFLHRVVAGLESLNSLNAVS